MKKPVPDRSPCSSVPRIFTTAFPDFSKISLTSRLMDAVEDSGAWTGAEGGVVSSARARAMPPKTASASARLEPESCLITHWRTIQHVTRWRRDPPDRFLQEFVPLPAMEFVEKILEVTWRRLLIFFEPQKLADLFFA